MRLLPALLISVISLLPVTASAAEGWVIDAPADIHVEAGAAKLSFSCQSGDVAMEIAIPPFDGYTADMGLQYYADDNLAAGFDLTGMTYLKVNGAIMMYMSPSGGFARVAREANKVINVAVTKDGQRMTLVQFPAKGSSAAVNSLARACPQ